MNYKIRIGNASGVMCEFQRSTVMKREHSKSAKLSNQFSFPINLDTFKSVFLAILTYGHES